MPPVFKRFFIPICWLTCLANVSAATRQLFLTGGQSNTDGRLYAATLPTYLQAENSWCQASCHSAYSADRLGVFQPYYPTSGAAGQPARWAYDAVTYYYIGQALKETFYVAKTSYGGTSIDPSVNNSGDKAGDAPFLSEYGSGYHWSADPAFLASTDVAGRTFVSGGNTYTGQSMLKAWTANIDAAIDAIKANGDEPEVKAIIWHQGESDKNVGGSYLANLRAMVAYVRQHLVEKTGESRYATLPFFCGTIPHASSLYNSAVEKAFFALEEEDANFHTVDLRDLTMLSDTKHFDAASAELFGRRLYNRMVGEAVVQGSRLDVDYAEVDYSDFGTDEYVGEEKTWTFNAYTANLITTTTIQDGLYLHSNSSNGRCFLSQAASVSRVTFDDGTAVSVSRVLTTNNGGAYRWTPDKIAQTTHASTNFILAVAANMLYAGRFSAMLSAPGATASSPVTLQLIFNGRIVKELAVTDTKPHELYYDAKSAGTYYIYSASQYSMYAFHYAPSANHTTQRIVQTDGNGFAVFGNLSGACLGLPDGLLAWAVSPAADVPTHVTLTPLTTVGRGEAALLQGTPDTAYTLPFAWGTPAEATENSMTAQRQTADIETTSGEDFINYTFANNCFNKVSGQVTLEAGQAYLSISNGAVQANYPTLTIPGVEPVDQAEEGDLDGDGELTVNDITYLIQLYLKKAIK